MITCPKCEFANADDAQSCARCGSGRYAVVGSAVATLEAGGPDTAVPADRTPAPSGAISVRPRTVVADPNPADEPPSALTLRNRPTPATHRAEAVAATAASPVAAPVQVRHSSPAPTPLPAPPQVRVKLVVIRGVKIGAEYPVYEGRNTIGRFVDKPVDVDLLTQETVEQTWCSRHHATVTFDRGVVLIEDLNSLNGTWINGTRIHPGQPRVLKSNDVIQVGTVQLKLAVE
jgi:hypothetical protein